MGGFYSVTMYLVAMAALLLVASTPALHWADAPPSDKPSRISALDGLRGFLAFSVFFHHAALSRHWILTGRWEASFSHFDGAIGPGAVAMFFMITGYLFWGKALKSRGRLAIGPLLLGRIFRIGPTYVVAFVLVMLLAGVATHFRLREPLTFVVREIAEWSLLGAGREIPINDYGNTWMLVAGVTWSLQWEWGFYLSLPLLAFCLPTRKRTYVAVALVIPASLFVSHVTYQPAFNLLAAFAIGMLCAAFSKPLAGRLRPVLSAAAIAAIIAALLCPHFETSSGWIRGLPILWLGAAFLLVSSGASIFGLLTSRAAKRLGDISYPVYLLQGIALLPLHATTIGRRLLIGGPLSYWCIVVTAAIALVALSTLVHVLIERPGIILGRAASDRVFRSPPTRADAPA